MELSLKSVSPESIPKALRKAHQYRLLGEPSHSESICRDVLSADPENQQALDILILALTDQFGGELSERFNEAMSLRMRLADTYRQAYLEGLILERRAMALFRRGGTEVGSSVYRGIVKAMKAYQRAMEMSPRGDAIAILRWNTCVRIIDRYPSLKPEPLE